MNAPDRGLLDLLAYRMEAIAIGQLALRYSMSWEQVPSMEVYFNGKQVIEGLATGFTNAAIEAAVIHCRAILEFLGLQVVKGSCSAIKQRPGIRAPDDWGVEQFPGLSMLAPEKALAAYPGPAAEAEAALALLFYSANKGLAHMSKEFDRSKGNAQLLDIAFRGTPALLVNGFYAPLGISPPSCAIKSRPRNS